LQLLRSYYQQGFIVVGKIAEAATLVVGLIVAFAQ